MKIIKIIAITLVVATTPSWSDNNSWQGYDLASDNNSWQGYDLAMEYIDNEMYEEAILLGEQGVAAGDTGAEYILCLAYIKLSMELFREKDGQMEMQTIISDFTQPVKWCRKGAIRNERDAQFQLGYIYLFGVGVDASKTKSKFWTRKAMKQNHVRAKKLWGVMGWSNN